MWFRRLDYPRGQPFAIPYITEVFYAGSVILIVVLVIINIILAGNDVVTVLKKDPDNTDSKWWAPHWIPESLTLASTPGPCQPLTLPQHATSIRTNSTLPIFSYTILNGLGTITYPNGTQEAKWYDALPYRNEPLEKCTVQNITAMINFQDRGITVMAQIVCDIRSQNPDAPSTLKLSTTFSRMANTDLGSDDIVNYISSYAVPRTTDISKAQAVLLANDVPALKMLGVLDAVGSDILKALWAQKWLWKLTNRDNQWPDQAVVKWAAQANCTNLERCRTTGPRVEGIDTWYSNTKGSQDFSPEYLRPMNTSVYNYFMVLRDALHLDLGNIEGDQNIFLNSDAFRARVLSDPFMSRIASGVIGVPRPLPASPGAYSATEFWRTCTWGWGCFNGTWTDALRDNASAAVNITNGLPLRSVDNSHPTVIDVDYVCPVFQTKQPGPFLVSVFVGTFSMYTALAGIFMFIAPLLDERYRKKHGLRQNNQDEEGDVQPYFHLTHPYQAPPHSSAPYATVFEAPDYQYHNTDAVPRYDPVPDHIFLRASRKGEELPPGAYTPGTPGVHTPKQTVGVLLPIAQISKLTLARTASRDSEISAQATWDSSAQDRTPPLAGPSATNPTWHAPPGLSHPSSIPVEGAILGGYFAPSASTAVTSRSRVENPVVAHQSVPSSTPRIIEGQLERPLGVNVVTEQNTYEPR
ncbi:putative transmembrane protein [Rhizoctonia solani 123E]|uniref:Putative transmembrane protein n=1 Tax=Rhizoctonia solani 123E TaxID=1423351 RepID=A0A074RU33_9AGAM|nr:putative transmembrane protein [Rhizoctonia solani 123E]